MPIAAVNDQTSVQFHLLFLFTMLTVTVRDDRSLSSVLLIFCSLTVTVTVRDEPSVLFLILISILSLLRFC